MNRARSGPASFDHSGDPDPRPIAWGALLSRILENPANPTGWSVPLGRLAGIRFRGHLLTVFFVAFMLAWSIPFSHAGIPYMALAMLGLLIAAFLHELGRALVTRRAGGETDRAILLPVGGLPTGVPPFGPRARAAAALGGAAANLCLLPLTCAALAATGLGSEILFNPFEPSVTAGAAAFSAASNTAHFAKLALWWLHYTNLVMLGLNLFIPAFPMDAARLLHALLQRRMADSAALESAATVGLFASIALGVLGLVAEQSVLVALAALTAWCSWVERRRARGENDLIDFPTGPPAADRSPDPAPRDRERKAAAELDRILSKIRATGMTSLSRAEKKTLRRETERQRKASPGGAAPPDA